MMVLPDEITEAKYQDRNTSEPVLRDVSDAGGGTI
jgi:hypothetical protein